MTAPEGTAPSLCACVSTAPPGCTRALDGFTLDVAAGEAVALVGASGAGKSTALRAVNGLERLTAGRVTVALGDAAPVGLGDADEATQVSWRRRIGWVVEGAGLFPHRTAAQNVATLPELLGWAPASGAATAWRWRRPSASTAPSPSC